MNYKLEILWELAETCLLWKYYQFVLSEWKNSKKIMFDFLKNVEWKSLWCEANFVGVVKYWVIQSSDQSQIPDPLSSSAKSMRINEILYPARLTLPTHWRLCCWSSPHISWLESTFCLTFHIKFPRSFLNIMNLMFKKA